MSDAFTQRYIGQSEIVNYEKSQYNAGAQNWAIRQDVEGRMYFANNEGLLSFDGTYWKLYPLPNKTILRAMEFGKDKKIYVGGQDEFGYFAPDKNGKLVFNSLVGLIPEADRRFADIWTIITVGEDVYFRSSGRIFRFHNNKITSYPAASSWIYLGLVSGRLLAQDGRTGLSEFRGAVFTTIIPADELPAGIRINDMTALGDDTALVSTNRFGLFRFGGNTLTPLRLTGMAVPTGTEFSGAVIVDPEHVAVSTNSNGFYLINRNGWVLDNFSKRDGLQHNSIRTMFLDKSNNIWFGLDSGIDFIAINNAVKHISPPVMNDGSGFAVSMMNGNLYFGLSSGIFRMPLPAIRDLSYASNETSLVTWGQTYGFSIVNNEMLAAMDDGFYLVRGDQASAISRGTGFWTFESIQQFKQGPTIAAGTYLGVRLFDYNNGVFTERGSVANFRASARFLEIDNDQTIWVSHPYRGIYKIDPAKSGLNHGVRLFTQSNGLPSTLNNHVYKVKNKVIIATEKGIYEYNHRADSFQLSDYYKDIFGTRGIRYLKEDGSGNIWFVQEKNIGVVDFSTREPKLIFFPELTGKIMSGFEHIYPVNDNNIFVGGEKGFYHINYEKYKQTNAGLSVFIRTVKAMGSSEQLLYDGYSRVANGSSAQREDDVFSLGHDLNSFHFEFSSPLYEQQSNIEYSYKLRNFDRDWSDWSKKTEKDYTNLPAGNYTFQVRMRNNLRGESAISSYSIVVLPPWYFTTWAWLFYALLGVGIMWWFYKKHQRKLQSERLKHQEEQKKQAYLHTLELEKSEKEVVKLRNEKLEAEIGYKNSQLASTAMHLVQKEEFLQKIREELQHMNKTGKEKHDPGELKKILRIMAEEEKVTEEWEQFSVHFDKVNGDFLMLLKERYPDLKAHELKLCAYLRMNLSSKEVAQLMSISVRGVEISRYRLRKKLQIPRETNLFQFLFDIQRKEVKNEVGD
ncbi:MAG: triple tyrosine motif-containing protein [Chitinophagaceae bacterium]